MHGIGRALAVRPAAEYWDRMIASYRKATDEGEREGFAVALAACVTARQVADLIELSEHRRAGDDSRLYSLTKIMLFGGEQGWSLVASLVDDPVLGKESTALTKRAETKADV